MKQISCQLYQTIIFSKPTNTIYGANSNGTIRIFLGSQTVEIYENPTQDDFLANKESSILASREIDIYNIILTIIKNCFTFTNATKDTLNHKSYIMLYIRVITCQTVSLVLYKVTIYYNYF